MVRALVQVRDLHKSFTRGTEQIEVLQDLTLDVNEGEFLALMGPSGSGKTTLLNLIAGLDRPTEGSITVGENLISGMSESELARWRTRHVGFIFQFYYLLPVLTAYENVELPLLLLPLTKEQRRKQVTNVLDLVGLSSRMSHRPGQLSGGQQQRVGIARAMVTDPELIVADEPTGDLDTKSADEVLKLMEILRAQLNKTIIMVTHDPKAASRAQRILHLEKGQLVLDTATV
jgi:putative ABC transport system ATP-binding protein